MDASLLGDERLYALLQHVDEDLAAAQRAGGCPRCAGPLHAAPYRRKPRGVPRRWAEAYGRRLSLCCARPGCRGRATPPSVRFLGPKVYVGAVVVLVSALRCGPTPARLQRLQELIGVSRRTVMRWRRWWTEQLADTSFWRAACAVLMPPVAIARLPASLLERFAGAGCEQVAAALRWLAPLSTASGGAHER
jgi:hypothetical protein